SFTVTGLVLPNSAPAWVRNQGMPGGTSSNPVLLIRRELDSWLKLKYPISGTPGRNSNEWPAAAAQYRRNGPESCPDSRPDFQACLFRGHGHAREVGRSNEAKPFDHSLHVSVSAARASVRYPDHGRQRLRDLLVE